jgi:hypothetical protein
MQHQATIKHENRRCRSDQTGPPAFTTHRNYETINNNHLLAENAIKLRKTPPKESEPCRMKQPHAFIPRMDGWIQLAFAVSSLNNNRDLFYVIALSPHQLPGKVDPRRWHCKQSRNAAARSEKTQLFHNVQLELV